MMLRDLVQRERERERPHLNKLSVIILIRPHGAEYRAQRSLYNGWLNGYIYVYINVNGSVVNVPK